VTDSLFRTIATATHAKLTTILEAESRPVPDLVFGNTPLETWNPSRRMAWYQDGGRIVLDHGPENAVDGTDPPSPPLAMRKANCVVRMCGVSEEEVEHYLDRLLLAIRRLDEDEPNYSRNFSIGAASYLYPSQMVGVTLKNGVNVIQLNLPLDLPVASQPDGAVVLVTVAAIQPRVGIANPPDEDDEDVEYDLDRWAP
jgi:hypothetical protein